MLPVHAAAHVQLVPPPTVVWLPQVWLDFAPCSDVCKGPVGRAPPMPNDRDVDHGNMRAPGLPPLASLKGHSVSGIQPPAQLPPAAVLGVLPARVTKQARILWRGILMHEIHQMPAVRIHQTHFVEFSSTGSMSSRYSPLACIELWFLLPPMAIRGLLFDDGDASAIDADEPRKGAPPLLLEDLPHQVEELGRPSCSTRRAALAGFPQHVPYGDDHIHSMYHTR